MFAAKIIIHPKPTVNDPQGQTITGALHQLEFTTVESVRVGKYIVIRVDEDDENLGAEKIHEMCKKMLSNPIIEDYEFILERINSDNKIEPD